MAIPAQVSKFRIIRFGWRVIVAILLLTGFALPARAIVILPSTFGLTETLTSCTTDDTCGIAPYVDSITVQKPVSAYILGVAVGNPRAVAVISSPPGWTASITQYIFILPNGLQETVTSYVTADPTPTSDLVMDEGLGEGVDVAAAGSVATGGAVSPFQITYWNGSDPSTVSTYSGMTTTPLPSTWLMMLTGLVGLGVVAHRRKKNLQSLAAD